jgi:hypothetical protein
MDTNKIDEECQKVLHKQLALIVETTLAKINKYNGSCTEIGVVMFKDITSLRSLIQLVVNEAATEAARILIINTLTKRTLNTMNQPAPRSHVVTGDAVEADTVIATPKPEETKETTKEEKQVDE